MLPGKKKRLGLSNIVALRLQMGASRGTKIQKKDVFAFINMFKMIQVCT